MKLLSIVLARSVWLFPLNDINPKGRNLYPLIHSFLIDTYKFNKYPQLGEETDESKGIVFDNGEYKNEKGESLSIRFTIFNFGIMAENRSSTNDSDFFLETFYNQINETFNIPEYDSIVKGRDYLSQMNVTTDKSLEIVNPKINLISEYLSYNLSHNRGAKYQLSSLSFWPDPTQSVNPLNFIFERQVSVAFSENRYFSSVPLQTEKHFELLEILEDVLS